MDINQALPTPSIMRTDQFQFLRFLAFLNIFIWHANVWNFLGYPAANSAASAVSFFIILSGFLSGYMSYNKDTTLCFRSYTRYMWRKIKQVYPLHLLTTVIAIFFTGIPYALSVYNFSAIEDQLEQGIRNLLLLQSWFQTGYFSYNGVSWFLSTIMFLYLLNMPVAVILNKIKKIEKSNIWLILFFLLIVGITTFYCYCTRESNMEFWQYVFPPSRIGEYVGGMVLGFILCPLKCNVAQNKTNSIIFTGLEIMAIVCWVVSLYMPVPSWKYRIINWLIPNFFLLSVFVFGIGYISSIFRQKILVHLGDISFQCFLLHLLVIRLYESMTGIQSVSKFGNILSLFLCLFVTVFMAHLIYNGSTRQKK